MQFFTDVQGASCILGFPLSHFWLLKGRLLCLYAGGLPGCLYCCFFIILLLLNAPDLFYKSSGSLPLTGLPLKNLRIFLGETGLTLMQGVCRDDSLCLNILVKNFLLITYTFYSYAV